MSQPSGPTVSAKAFLQKDVRSGGERQEYAAYKSWYQGKWFQVKFRYCPFDWCTVSVDSVAGSHNTISEILTQLCYPLHSVRQKTEMMKFGFWNEALRTWADTLVLNRGKKHSVIYIVNSQRSTLNTCWDSLFWVICRVSEDARKYSAIFSIIAFYNDPILIRINKFFVQQNLPHRMCHFSFTVSHDVIVVSLLRKSRDKLNNATW